MVLLLDSEGGKKKPVPSSGLGKSSTGSTYGKSKAAVASQGVVIGETGSASGKNKTVYDVFTALVLVIIVLCLQIKEPKPLLKRIMVHRRSCPTKVSTGNNVQRTIVAVIVYYQIRIPVLTLVKNGVMKMRSNTVSG